MMYHWLAPTIDCVSTVVKSEMTLGEAVLLFGNGVWMGLLPLLHLAPEWDCP